MASFLDAKHLTDRKHIITTSPIPNAGGVDGNYFYSGDGQACYTGIRWSF